MTKLEAITLFNEGKTIRLTGGIWNNPKKDGKIAKSVDEIEDFFSWAYVVDLKNIEKDIIDLQGASCCDMF